MGPIPKRGFIILLMIVLFESDRNSSALKYDPFKALSAELSFGLTVFDGASFLLSFFSCTLY